MAWVASAILGSSLVGAAGSAYAASKASDAQQAAATTAANTQLSMYNQTNQNLSPYRNLGSQATGYASDNLSKILAPVNINGASISDPNSVVGQAYNFINTQGQKAVTNSSAARGLASSGAALKGASSFTTGLADSTYQDLFNMATTNQTNSYNRLMGLINTGENAAAGTGAAATSTGQGVAASETAAGNAQAAGYNAAGTAASNFASSVPTSIIASGLYGKLAGSTPATGLPVSTTAPV